MAPRKSSKPPTAVVIPILAIAAFIVVASVLQAISEDSWAPIWAIGWLPAVLVASLWTPAARKSCGPRLRSPTGR